MEYREGNETKKRKWNPEKEMKQRKKKWNIEKEMKHREENGIY